MTNTDYNGLVRHRIPITRENRLIIAAIVAVFFFAMGLIGWASKPAAPSSLASILGLPAAVATIEEGASSTTPPYVEVPMFQYIEVVDSCGPYYDGTCVNLRSGPGENYAIVEKLRTGMVLKVAALVSRDGRQWYKIAFDNEIRYPERVSGNWYVAADVVRVLSDDGDHLLQKDSPTTTKRIVVDISSQTLSAYDGDTLFMRESISTGKEFTPTPRGTFSIFKMTPSRYMQGPLPGVSDQVYDLPGVPWNMYFTKGGAVIHGAYWHDHFGVPWSHGCVNLPAQKAMELYLWAIVGTAVVVQN